jgi:hypothetical protein
MCIPLYSSAYFRELELYSGEAAEIMRRLVLLTLGYSN